MYFRSATSVFVPVLFVLLHALISPDASSAQTVSNGRRVAFRVSRDHSAKLRDGRPKVSRYELKLYRVGQSTPFVTVNLGKPVPRSDGIVSIDFRSRLTAVPPMRVWIVARISAVGPTGSGVSQPSNQFQFLPNPRGTPGDLSGDGGADLALFRYASATWIARGQTPVVFGRRADLPVPGNYNGVPGDERAVFRPATGEWIIAGRRTTVLGKPGDIPVPADYNGDRRADIAVFRPVTGMWYIAGADGVRFGGPGDIPVPGDYNGDGRAEIAVFRPSTGVWYIRGRTAFKYGSVGDIPVPADYNGDGRVDVAVYRRSTGTWYVRNQFTIKWGVAGDVAIPLDVNGDRRADLAVWRPRDNSWHVLFGRVARLAVSMGQLGDRPVSPLPHLARATAFDADGDQRADPGVYRPSVYTWLTLRSARNYTSSFRWTVGLSTSDAIAPGDYDGDRRVDAAVCSTNTCRIVFSSSSRFIDLPNVGASRRLVPGDYDGDGRTDFATFTPADGVWRVYLSSTEFTSRIQRRWGSGPGDIPVPGDFDGDGRSDFAYFRPSTGTWHVATYSGRSTFQRRHGARGDRAFARDVDGDGRADMVLYRPSSRVWTVWTSASSWTTALPQVTYGRAGDVPAPADYNGDGAADLGVFRPSTGTWHMRGVGSVQWGRSGDIPVESR